MKSLARRGALSTRSAARLASQGPAEDDMTLMHQGGFGRGLTNADVVNDDAAAARVALRGEVNGQPFLVERTVRP